MALTRRGKWWHAATAKDLDQFLLKHVLSKPPKGTEHRIIHAVCGGKCRSRKFDLEVDEARHVARICTKCEKEHRICDPDGSYVRETAGEVVCPCMYSEVAVAVGFEHRLVQVKDPKKGEHDVPVVRWVSVAGRCTNCGLCGVYGDWKAHSFPSDLLYDLV